MAERFSAKLREWFEADLRSLAVFRMGLAACILADLAVRSQDLVAHYTDFGLLPRAALLSSFTPPWRLSLHVLSGQAFVQAGLFLLAAFFALRLAVGYRTLQATVLSWVLLLSLHVRNPMVLQGGDVLLRLLVFWSMFVPLGARFSVDSARNSASQPVPGAASRGTRRSRLVGWQVPEGRETGGGGGLLSMGTIALFLQVVFLYAFTVALKFSPASKPVWWDQGVAVYNALQIDQFATPLGLLARSAPPAFLRVLNYKVLFLETVGVLALFSPVWTSALRAISAFSLMGMHLGIRLFMEIGPFTWVGALAMIVFLPAAFWDMIFRFLSTRKRFHIEIYYDGECGFCRKSVRLVQTFLLLPGMKMTPAQAVSSIQADLERENSWVIVDAAGGRHFKYDAFLMILRASPLAFPLEIFFRWAPLARLGRWIYEKTAANRGSASIVLAWMKESPQRLPLPRPASFLAAFLLGLTFFWNLGGLRAAWGLPAPLQNVCVVLGLDQRWDMFSPPLTDDGWYVIPGTLRNGLQIDVWRGGAPVEWGKPGIVSRMYRNERWRKYMMNLWLEKNLPYRLYYGQFLCRDWNAGHTAGEQLETFEIFFMREDTLPGNQMAAPKRVSVWKHYCFKVPSTQIGSRL